MRFCPFCAVENFDAASHCVGCAKRLPPWVRNPSELPDAPAGDTLKTLATLPAGRMIGFAHAEIGAQDRQQDGRHFSVERRLILICEVIAHDRFPEQNIGKVMHGPFPIRYVRCARPRDEKVPGKRKLLALQHAREFKGDISPHAVTEQGIGLGQQGLQNGGQSLRELS